MSLFGDVVNAINRNTAAVQAVEARLAEIASLMTPTPEPDPAIADQLMADATKIQKALDSAPIPNP